MMAKGYTLIELMVVVAIIGIISAIAYPSYQAYTCDTFIGQWVADMKVCALGLERFYSNDFTYVGATIGGVCSAVSPTQGTQKFDLALSTLTQTNFVVTATPVGSCGTTMTLDAAGTLTVAP